eukprot:gene12411-13695_t
MEVLRNALKENEIEEDVYDTLSSLESYRVPRTTTELKELVTELARRDLLMKTSYIKEAWEDVLSGQMTVKNLSTLNGIYERGKATGKKILKLLCGEPKNDRESETLKYLKEFIRTPKKEDIPIFMRYTTGLDMLCVEKIDVVFTKITGMQRRIVTHTCGPVLDGPATYDSYPEFKEEFLTLLKCGYWSMDFA